MSTDASFSPSEIERVTGFGKDQLRKWRQRFGFPLLESTVNGKSAYSSQTVDKLLLIKRLLEAGFRLGQVVGMTTPGLENLLLGLESFPTRFEPGEEADIPSRNEPESG